MGASAQQTLVTDIVIYFHCLRRKEGTRYFALVQAEALNGSFHTRTHGRIPINWRQLTTGRTARTDQARISICSRICLENLA